MASRKRATTGRFIAGSGKGAANRTGQKAVSRTANRASTYVTKNATAETGRTVSKSAASGAYRVASSKALKTAAPKAPASHRVPVAGKTVDRPRTSKGTSEGGTTARQRKVTAGAIAAAAKSAPYGRSAGRPAGKPEGLPRELQEYLEAFVAEFNATLVPAIVQRMRAGAVRLSPKELTKRMLAVAPAPAPANKMAEQVGPAFYDTAGVTVVLVPPGTDPISKQAVEHRRKRRSILALQTSDGRWIYPTWQFRDHVVIPGLAEILAIFDEHPSWSVATWLTTPTADLDGLTAVQWLDERRDRNRLLRVARRTAHRWAA